MNRIAILFLLLFAGSVIDAQVIKGRVMDESNGQPILFAHVYFSDTFVGTSSDTSGFFALDVGGRSHMPLTVSCVGYYSRNISNYSADSLLLVRLTPKVFEVEGLIVQSKSLVRARKANMKIFRRTLLGTTLNGLKCEIINEEDITFNYGSDRDTLIAYVSEPLNIYNKALGYKMICYLDRFEYNRRDRTFIYRGNIIYEEDMARDKAAQRTYDKRRKEAYFGSRMHFFRELWKDHVKKAGFMVKNISGFLMEYEDMVKEVIVEEEGVKKTMKFLSGQKGLHVFYFYKASSVYFLETPVYFDKNGYSDYSRLSWDGDMAAQRLGDWLPYEYKPKE